jgi:hypothetical protein
MPKKNDLMIFEAFDNKKVRKFWFKDEWHFSVVDIVGILAESKDPQAYWRQLKKRDVQIVTICHDLKTEGLGNDGKKYRTPYVTFEGFLRLVQSIPSPKAEPLKLKIAEWARQKIEEIVNPSLAVSRAMENYKTQGKSEEWIQQRLIGVGDRKNLTDEWKDRGVKNFQYGTLTNELYKGTFKATSKELKQAKRLAESQNLRDHMTSGELLSINATEVMAKDLHVSYSSHGFQELKKDCIQAGDFGGKVFKLYKDSFREIQDSRKEA